MGFLSRWFGRSAGQSKSSSSSGPPTASADRLFGVIEPVAARSTSKTPTTERTTDSVRSPEDESLRRTFGIGVPPVEHSTRSTSSPPRPTEDSLRRTFRLGSRSAEQSAAGDAIPESDDQLLDVGRGPGGVYFKVVGESFHQDVLKRLYARHDFDTSRTLSLSNL